MNFPNFLIALTFVSTNSFLIPNRRALNLERANTPTSSNLFSTANEVETFSPVFDFSNPDEDAVSNFERIDE